MSQVLQAGTGQARTFKLKLLTRNLTHCETHRTHTVSIVGVGLPRAARVCGSWRNSLCSFSAFSLHVEEEAEHSAAARGASEQRRGWVWGEVRAWVEHT